MQLQFCNVFEPGQPDSFSSGKICNKKFYLIKQFPQINRFYTVTFAMIKSPMAHTEKSLLQQKLNQAETQVTINTKYRHTKTGGEYLVLRLGINERTEEVSVIYQELSHPEKIIWIRSLEGEDGWLTPTEINGELVPRFTKIK